jgi:hypothetical protein
VVPGSHPPSGTYSVPVRAAIASALVSDAAWSGPRDCSPRWGCTARAKRSPRRVLALDSAALGNPKTVCLTVLVLASSIVASTSASRGSAGLRDHPGPSQRVAAILRVVVVTTGRSSQSPACGW